MEKKKPNRRSTPVTLIVEPIEGGLNFVDFVEAVLNFEMVKGDRFAGLVVLERPQSKPNDSKDGKQ